MSKRNGDKARANREQQKKLLRRQRNQELRQRLQSEQPQPANSGQAASTTERAE